MKKISEYTGGYLVEYSRKNSYPEPYGERTKMICSQEELVKLLQQEFKYAVWRCNYIRVQMYLDNHPEEDVEVRL